MGDAEVVVVTFANPRVLRGYRRRFADPLTVVADEERLLYRALGFGRGSFWRIWGWKSARKYIELLREGHQLEKTDADTRQLGGNAVVGADGRLSWVFAGDGPDDRPTVDQIISAVRDAERSGGPHH
jgi:hypothetical protein